MQFFAGVILLVAFGLAFWLALPRDGGGHIGEVGDPEHVRTWRPELTIDVIQRARGCLVAGGYCYALAPDRSLKAHIAHQPLYRTPRHLMGFSRRNCRQTLRTP